MDDLEHLLGELGSLVWEAGADQLVELRRRLSKSRLRILVAGEANRGKSTLINALLGRDLLPTGVLPLTAVATTIDYGPTDSVVVTYRDGRTELVGVDKLSDLVTEDGNPENSRGIAAVDVLVPDEMLRTGIELVDTPGVGSIYEHNSSSARAALRSMDVALFVTSADPPVSANEREFLAEVREESVRVIVVLTKADRLAPQELCSVRSFAERTVTETLRRDTPIRVVSARTALDAPTAGARDASGIPQLRAALADYRLHSGDRDLVLSVARHAYRLAAEAAGSIRLTLRAADLDDGVRRERQQVFVDRLREVGLLRQESTEILGAAVAALIRQLSEKARTAARAATIDSHADFDQWCASHSTLRAGELDRAGREWIRARVVSAASGWRSAYQPRLQAEIERLVARSQDHLAEQLRAVRAAAAEAFETQFDTAPIDAELIARSRFLARGAELGGFGDLLAAGVRNRLPGSLGRRRVAAALRRELGESIERGMGRVRADLQSQLQETERVLRAEMARRYEEALARITDAIEQGRALAASEAEGHRELRESLNARLTDLDRISARLLTIEDCAPAAICES